MKLNQNKVYFMFVDFYKFPERSSVTVDTSMDINNDGSSDKQNDMTEIEWDKPATTVSTIVADEETFAIDGDYEKFTENSMHKSINYKPVGNAERFHKTSLYEQKYRHHNSSFEDGKNIVFKVHQDTRHHRHDHHHHHHHHRCSRKQNSNCSLKRSQSDQCNKKMANSPSGITQSSSTKNIKAPEDITQHACFGSYHSAVDFKKQPPSSIEVILRLISQQLWTDLMSWLETTLSDNISANPSKSDGNAVIQKHIFHYPFPLYRLRDNTLSRCDSSVADTQNSLASPSCRLSKQAKHANVDASTFTSSQHAVQMNESNVELTDLLQISTKTLQIREKSIVNEATDNSNRIQYTGSNCLIDSISNHPQAAVSTSHSSSITMTTITTLVSRVSPQPVGTSSVTRPISSSHCKSSTNISRKSLLTFNSSMTEVPNHSGTSGVGVIGIAANLHHNGRLAPLDRIRTPLPSHYSSTLEEQIIVTTAIMPTLFANTESSLRSTYTSSLSRYRNVNVSQLSSSVTTGNTPPPPSPSAATTIVQNVSNPNTNGINQTFSTITTNTVNDSTVSRNFILPPLLNPTVNSTINTTAISLASFNPLATGLSISSPKTNFSVIHKTGFGLTQQSRQTGQHTPFLHKGNGGNLVAQQNNNSSVNTLLHIHRTTSKSSTHHNQSSPKQTSFPLPPIDASKDRLRKHKKLWRPYSSRPSIITKSITNSNLLARAYSTLLFQTPEMYGDTCSVKINPAIFIGSTTSCLRNNDSVSR
ncbi:unnamed protein product [Heterobilharzia americana]|nr:unnamed protein product [Heterobilharzia americana]